jgi:hypothetical protein
MKWGPEVASRCDSARVMLERIFPVPALLNEELPRNYGSADKQYAKNRN